MSRMPASQRGNFAMAGPMTRVAAGRTTTFKFEQVKPEARQQMSRHSNDVRKFVEERSRWESQGAGRAAGRPARERSPAAEPKAMPSPMKRQGPEIEASGTHGLGACSGCASRSNARPRPGEFNDVARAAGADESIAGYPRTGPAGQGEGSYLAGGRQAGRRHFPERAAVPAG